MSSIDTSLDYGEISKKSYFNERYVRLPECFFFIFNARRMNELNEEVLSYFCNVRFVL